MLIFHILLIVFKRDLLHIPPLRYIFAASSPLIGSVLLELKGSIGSIVGHVTLKSH